MATILDFEELQEERFEEWAREYLIIPDGSKFPVDVLMSFLVGNKVFTFEEIRSEMQKRKIVIHERIYKLAAAHVEAGVF